MRSDQLVSIAIPVYNGSNYLSKSIESALCQSYSNIEIIVVNDGSTDDGSTRRIVEGYQGVRYFEKVNGGVASALNLAIAQMRGSFFSWLSHDDVYYPYKIEKQVEFYFSKPDGKKIVFSHEDIIDENGTIIKKGKTIHLGNDPFAYTLLYRGFLGGCSLLIPRHAFDHVGCFDSRYKTVQDYDLWFRMLKKGYSFMYCPIASDQSRRHPNQDSKTKKDLHKKEADSLLLRTLISLPKDIWLTNQKNRTKAVAKLYLHYLLQGHNLAANYIRAKLLPAMETGCGSFRFALFFLWLPVHYSSWVFKKGLVKLEKTFKKLHLRF